MQEQPALVSIMRWHRHTASRALTRVARLALVAGLLHASSAAADEQWALQYEWRFGGTSSVSSVHLASVARPSAGGALTRDDALPPRRLALYSSQPGLPALLRADQSEQSTGTARRIVPVIVALGAAAVLFVMVTELQDEKSNSSVTVVSGGTTGE